MSFDVVIPTVGRASLGRLLDALAAQREPLPRRPIVVDDRAAGNSPRCGGSFAGRLDPIRTGGLGSIRTGGLGPAAARNAGWRAGESEWVAFLDDDVVPPPDWSEKLLHDLARLGDDGGVGGSQGAIRVPLPRQRRPTDWERHVAGLRGARWATADMAYRRSALERVGGFDERFTRAYREDADIGLRMLGAGLSIAQGEREVLHPPGAAFFWASVRLQRGNADDVLMRKLHGRDWRARAGAPRGRLARHQAIVGGAALALLARRAPLFAPCARARGLARGAGAAAAAAGVAELAWARIAPGPRDWDERARMLLTSLVVPFAAVAHRLAGEVRWRGAPALLEPPDAILFDRDDTLIHDVPYNGDPARVRPVQGAREVLGGLRRAGVRVAVISNQSGVGRGLIDDAQVAAVNRRVEELLGPIELWLHCPHVPQDGCACRKPAPGLVLRAAELLGVRPDRCAVIGDVGSDVEAACAAGARSVLVPTERTRREEIAAAPATAPDLHAAVRLLMG